jgi:glycosyltransferase involved in cell wall biosynthesis
MNGPLVTVVTAAYNAERSIGEALTSLFAQDYRPFESIVVDDGSTDETPRVIARFPDVVYRRQENQGPAAARNTALAIARGNYVAFLDADDVLPPTKLSMQVDYLERHSHVDCVLGRQELILDGIAAPDWLKRDSIYGELGGIPLISAMMRRRTLVELGGFDPDPTFRYAEDRDLFVRMREHDVEFEVLDEVVLYRRCDGSNMYFRTVPERHPLLHSLKAKLDRERSVAGRDEDAA